MESKKVYKSFLVLMIFTMLYVTADLSSNLLVFKPVNVFSFMELGSVFIYPLTYLAADIVAELYGVKIGRFLVYLGLIFSYLFALFLIAIIHLPSKHPWALQNSYDTVINPLIKLGVVNTIAVLISGIINVYCISRFRIILRGRFFGFRSIAATAIGEIFYLLIIVTLIFWGHKPFPVILELITANYIFKLFYATIGAIPASIFVNYAKNNWGIGNDSFVLNFNNPFKDNQNTGEGK